MTEDRADDFRGRLERFEDALIALSNMARLVPGRVQLGSEVYGYDAVLKAMRETVERQLDRVYANEVRKERGRS